MHRLDLSPVVRPLVDGSVHVAWVDDGRGISGGACAPDPDVAVRRALGEYAEHLGHTSAAAVVAVRSDPGGLPVVAPAAWHAAGTPKTSWVQGQGLRDGRSYAVPAQAVFLGWDPPSGEVRWCTQTSAGTGAHTDSARAQRAALLELVERQVLTRGWSTGDIAFEDLDHLRETLLPSTLWSALQRYDVRLRLVRVAGARADIVLAMVHRTDGTVLTCGSAARGSTAEAATHAVCEAIAVRLALASTRRPTRLQTLDRARAVTVSANGPAHLRFVAERVVGPGSAHSVPLDLESSVDIAGELFGHQPVDVPLGRVEHHVVHRVVGQRSDIPEPRTGRRGLVCPVV